MTLDNIKIPLRKFKDPRYVNAANTANITESGAYFQVRKYGSTTMGFLMCSMFPKYGSTFCYIDFFSM